MSPEAEALRDFNNHPSMVAIREATARLKARDAKEVKRSHHAARTGFCATCGASTVRDECRLCVR